MKYFIATGFRPCAHAPKVDPSGSYSNVSFSMNGRETRKQMVQRYNNAGIPLPKLGETVFFRYPSLGRISLLVFGPYDALILIVAPSQSKAYLLSNAFRAVTTCFDGNSYHNDCDYLLEIGCRPTSEMSRKNLTQAIALHSHIPEGSIEETMIELALGSGTVLDHIQLTKACDIVKEALSRPLILDALLHLEYSCNLVWGFMVGSFYESHYSRDRREISHYRLEHVYLENRFRYDSAFVAAFRGIECILGKPHFKSDHIQSLLARTDHTYKTRFSSSRYRSWHEVFSSRRKWWLYADLIAYYLKLRNSVSAHGNPSPPHIVMEDQVFEIQYLLRSMIGNILIPETEHVKNKQASTGDG